MKYNTKVANKLIPTNDKEQRYYAIIKQIWKRDI